MIYNLLFYSIIICTAFFFSYCLYYLIKNNYLSKNITATTKNSSNTKIEANNKNVAYKNITKISLIPSSELNGNLSASSIYESKFEEMYQEYAEEIAEFRVTEAEV
jgi:hypothetical protein